MEQKVNTSKEQKEKRSKRQKGQTSKEHKGKAFKEQKGKTSNEQKGKTFKEDKENLSKEKKGGTSKKQQGKTSKEQQGKTSKEQKRKPSKEQKENSSKEEKGNTSKEQKENPSKEQKGNTSKEDKENISKEKKEKISKEQRGKISKEQQGKTSMEQKGKTTKEQKRKSCKEQKEKPSKEQKGNTSKEQKGKTSKKQQGKTSKEQQGKASKEQKGSISKEQNGNISKEQKGKTSKEDKEKISKEQKQKTSKEQQEKASKEQQGKTSKEQKGKTCKEQQGKASKEQKGKTLKEQQGKTIKEQGKISKEQNFYGFSRRPSNAYSPGGDPPRDPSKGPPDDKHRPLQSFILCFLIAFLAANVLYILCTLLDNQGIFSLGNADQNWSHFGNQDPNRYSLEIILQNNGLQIDAIDVPDTSSADSSTRLHNPRHAEVDSSGTCIPEYDFVLADNSDGEDVVDPFGDIHLHDSSVSPACVPESARDGTRSIQPPHIEEAKEEKENDNSRDSSHFDRARYSNPSVVFDRDPSSPIVMLGAAGSNQATVDSTSEGPATIASSASSVPENGLEQTGGNILYFPYYFCKRFLNSTGTIVDILCVMQLAWLLHTAAAELKHMVGHVPHQSICSPYSLLLRGWSSTIFPVVL